MFAKAKRFEIAAAKNDSKAIKSTETATFKTKPKLPATTASLPSKSSKPHTSCKYNSDAQSECSSVHSNKSAFVTPKVTKKIVSKATYSCKKDDFSEKARRLKKAETDTDYVQVSKDIVASQEVEIRNKDYTIAEYGQQIDDLKNEIAVLQRQREDCSVKAENNSSKEIEKLNDQISKVTIDPANTQNLHLEETISNYNNRINELQIRIDSLQTQCEKLESEVSEKQVELCSLEEIICIRDSLCKDLQDKLSEKERGLEETQQRLEMVQGHHALALEANESIRREYRVELDALKNKLEEDKQAINQKYKSEQEVLKNKYISEIESIRTEMNKVNNDSITELQHQIALKDDEMKAKLEQIEEKAHEKLRLCEIQYEQRNQSMQEHWLQQQEKLQQTEQELTKLKYSMTLIEQEKMQLRTEVNQLFDRIDVIKKEKSILTDEVEDLKEAAKQKSIDFENEINRLTVNVDRAVKDKHRFETSLTVTRDIVQVLSRRLRASDDEVENLETTVKTLHNDKQFLENELLTYKNTLNNTILECNEYKEALVNILKSKAALAKEHTRIMEHNVTLIESLQNVEKEAYRELGSIKNEMVEDVEMLKKESSTQIQQLRQEAEKKGTLAVLATEQAGQAVAAAEKARVLLAQAAHEISRLEHENLVLQQQIQDQQSLAVEVSLLRQENEELTMTVAKQASVVDKLTKEVEHHQLAPKSPSLHRKTYNKVGKENTQIILSPLRERNH